jgi:hypothetical protein
LSINRPDKYCRIKMWHNSSRQNQDPSWSYQPSYPIPPKPIASTTETNSTSPIPLNPTLIPPITQPTNHISPIPQPIVLNTTNNNIVLPSPIVYIGNPRPIATYFSICDDIIYALYLSDKCFYIGKTNNLDRRLEEHKSGKGTDWTREHPFVGLIETLGGDGFEENKVTKMYMAKYGIDQVRGGSYCAVKLNLAARLALENELKGSRDLCYKCGKEGHMVKDCPMFAHQIDKEKNTNGLSSPAATREKEEIKDVVVSNISFNVIPSNTTNKDEKEKEINEKEVSVPNTTKKKRVSEFYETDDEEIKISSKLTGEQITEYNKRKHKELMFGKAYKTRFLIIGKTYHSKEMLKKLGGRYVEESKAWQFWMKSLQDVFVFLCRKE